MPCKILLSTAYLPPAEYFFHIQNADEVFIEMEENYLKQSYRNRCYILAANGIHSLSVPVYLGSIHKTPVKDIRIDYSKRWPQVHLGAITSAYNSSPYFIYYFETIKRIILTGHKFLLDLNMDLLQSLLIMMRIEIMPSFTNVFKPVDDDKYDFRYKINPKKKTGYAPEKYLQVFSTSGSFSPRLSILDLVFNTGPEAKKYL